MTPELLILPISILRYLVSGNFEHVQRIRKKTKLSNMPFELLECLDSYSEYGSLIISIHSGHETHKR